MRRLHLKEAAAREVLLVRAIESEDPQGAVLTQEDRRYASATALLEHGLGDDPGAAQTGAFLQRRANLAMTRLLARYPVLRRVCGLSRWPHWANWLFPLGALAIGTATNVLDGPRLNILAFPLLGMLAWNLAVYLWLVVTALTPRREKRPVLQLVERWLQPIVARLAAQPTLERGVTRFAGDWAETAGALTRLRISRTLHFAAALFAVGVLAGMLARARYTASYSAGWAGTWAGAEQEIAWLIGVILGPASWLTGIALPTAERLGDLRESSENAGNWLILWSVTTVLFVVLPRLLLGLGCALRAGIRARRLPVPGTEDFYVRRLIRDALGRPGTARIVPYGLQLSELGRERLERLVQQAAGEKTRVRIDPAVDYGAEDTWLAEEGETLGDADQLLLLFNLGSTPEAENHGAFALGVRQRLAADGTGLTLLLDEGAFRSRFGVRRSDERLRAWQQVLAPTGLEPVPVAIDAGGEEEVGVRTLERALQRTPSPA